MMKLYRLSRRRAGITPPLLNDSIHSGFTFVELLVVITIVGVIFAVGAVTYSSITTRSRDARRKADMEAIRQSLEMCRSLTGSYPISIDNSISCSGSGPTLMTKTPLDPKSCVAGPTGKYAYTRPTTVTYTLSAPCMEVDTSYQVTNP